MHRAKKRFGQHFLVDTVAVERIIRAIRVQSGDHLVEIGPGQGSITDILAEQTLHHGAKLDLIELDKDLLPLLVGRYQDSAHVKVIEADALKVDYDELASGTDLDTPLRVVGNLPYNISSPLIFHLLKSAAVIQDMVFMLQEEVVDRMVAPPGSKTYGRLSVMVQIHCIAEKLFSVSPDCFDPPPKVMSAVVALTPEKRWKIDDEALFSALVEQAFAWRRKIFRHTLKQFVPASKLAQFDDVAELRPEQISPENFVRLANMVYNIQ